MIRFRSQAGFPQISRIGAQISRIVIPFRDLRSTSARCGATLSTFSTDPKGIRPLPIEPEKILRNLRTNLRNLREMSNLWEMCNPRETGLPFQKEKKV